MGLLYTDEPVFGIDIGRSTVKIMQIDHPSKKGGRLTVRAYGVTSFNKDAIDKGVITDTSEVTKAIHRLITKELNGKLTTKHVAISLPNSYSFTRILNAPLDIKKEGLESLVQTEIAQSIPVPISDLYYDYSASRVNNGKEQQVQLVASPQRIVDPYLEICGSLGLVPAIIEPNISSVTRMVVQSELHDEITLIMDLGSEASDLSIFDGNVIRVTGTVECGGESITHSIEKGLHVSYEQAQKIKARYGIDPSKKQAQILKATEPELQKLVSEVKKVVRYYAERAQNDGKIGQIIIMGGGANLPGLSGYVTNNTRIPTRLNAPWTNLSFGKLQPPSATERTIYTTAGGLSLASTKELGA